MARESQLWQWLAKARLYYKADLHMHRIENSASPGMPDVEGFVRGFRKGLQFWVELKSAARPARASTPIRFKVRPKQVEWARRRWAIGGAAYWLLQIGDGADRRIYLLDATHGRALQAGMLESVIENQDLLWIYDKLRPEHVIETMVRDR
jgi:hypothetical protein